MPWLVGTALIHSLAVTEKRGTFTQLDGAARDRRVLAVAARHVPRALRRADLGARVRHRSARAACSSSRSSRSSSAARWRSIAWRAPTRRRSAAASRRCRASRCCSPTTCCSSSRWRAVLLGTLYPLFLDALDLGKISVGPPYFDAVFVPLMAPLVFLMGVGPIARWQQARAARPVDAAAMGARRRAGDGRAAAVRDRAVEAARRVRPAAGRLGRRVRRSTALRAAAAQRAAARPRRQAAREPARVVRHALAHLGIAVFIVGVTLVQAATRSSATCGSTSGRASTWPATPTRSAASRRSAGPNYDAMVGTIDVARDGKRRSRRCSRRSAPTARRAR